MPGVKQEDQSKPTLLEVGLRVQGDFRRCLAPLRVTPLQAGVSIYLHRQTDAKVTDTATAVRVEASTLSVAVRALFHKRWMTGHRTPDDRRVVRLRLSRQGAVVA
ncbi:MAG: hypothetical protein ACREJN_14370, partial [Nitrospiraceae bacterium]